MDSSVDGVGRLRPREAELEGYAWLPRMFDKVRAEQAGVETGYAFGCPIDHTCMARLGIEPATVGKLVAELGDDHSVLRALRATGIPAAADAWFDAPGLEDSLHAGGPYLRVRTVEQLDPQPARGGRPFLGEEHGAGVSLVVIDAEPGYRQEPHTHPTQEVVVVQAGRLTFHLGETQSRILTAGQVVRVPADVVHWVENRASEPAHAVAAYGAATVSVERIAG